MVFDFPRYFFSYSSSSCCLDFLLNLDSMSLGFDVRSGFDFGFLCIVFLVAVSTISPSSVKVKPPDFCSPDSAFSSISDSGVGSGTSEVEDELGSGFSVPQLVQNFSSAEISEPVSYTHLTLPTKA